jgi:hypothetical protein
MSSSFSKFRTKLPQNMYTPMTWRNKILYSSIGVVGGIAIGSLGRYLLRNDKFENRSQKQSYKNRPRKASYGFIFDFLSGCISYVLNIIDFIFNLMYITPYAVKWAMAYNNIAVQKYKN